MGVWLNGASPNLLKNQNATYRFPRSPGTVPTTKTQTGPSSVTLAGTIVDTADAPVGLQNIVVTFTAGPTYTMTGGVHDQLSAASLPPTTQGNRAT